MPIDEQPRAPTPEPAADGWLPGQPECRTPSCNEPRNGFAQHCERHQPKQPPPPTDWNAMRQQLPVKRRRGRA